MYSEVGCVLNQAGQQKWADKYYLLEVVIPGTPTGQTGTVFNFPANIQQVNGKQIDRVWTFYPVNGTVPGAGTLKAPSGNSILYPSATLDIYFSLFVNGYEQVAKIPYLQAARSLNAGDNEGVKLYGNVVDWSISAVYLSAAPNNTQNQSVLFLVKYF